jgi:hypothetical protein
MKKEKKAGSESIEIMVLKDTLQRIRAIASETAVSEGRISEALLRLGLEAYTRGEGRPEQKDKEGGSPEAFSGLPR